VPTSIPPSEVPRRVLVVDDLPEILDLFKGLARRVRAVPIDLVTEVNSQKAKEMAAREPFDLVISDFRMRQVDGVEVLQAARDRNPDGFRVLMTGYNEVPTDIGRIQRARIDAYVQKPLRSADLLQLMLDLLQRNAAAIATCRARAKEMEDAAVRASSGLGVS
jgi:DNA-binding NtrC family response regulator